MASPQESGSNLLRPTQAQLDEMDLLMKRMMALPVGTTDNSHPSEQASDPGQRRVPIEEWADLQPAQELELQPFKLTNFQTPGPESIAILSVDREPMVNVVEEAVPVPAVLQPLVSINGAFDWFFRWLGPVGRFVIGPTGRGLLAWTGLFFIVIGLAWLIAEGLGLDLMELSQ